MRKLSPRLNVFFLLLYINLLSALQTAGMDDIICTQLLAAVWFDQWRRATPGKTTEQTMKWMYWSTQLMLLRDSQEKCIFMIAEHMMVILLLYAYLNPYTSNFSPLSLEVEIDPALLYWILLVICLHVYTYFKTVPLLLTLWNCLASWLASAMSGTATSICIFVICLNPPFSHPNFVFMIFKFNTQFSICCFPVLVS